MSESVLVVHTSLLNAYLSDHKIGLLRNGTRRIIDIVEKKYAYLERHIAEYDFNYKQIIPYVIITCKDRFLLLNRTSKQTEKRLHNKYSLGIGGHINPDSADNGGLIVGGLYKELNEEISLVNPGALKFVGIINDESSSVSRVHLGLFYILDLLSPGYEILEKEKMMAKWVTKDELKDCYPKLETWSQIVFDYFINS